jgi:RimJ/RimL family protein N-acetyltransferase
MPTPPQLKEEWTGRNLPSGLKDGTGPQDELHSKVDLPIFFFRIAEIDFSPTELPKGYRWSIWQPRLAQIIPRRMVEQRKRFASRWMMHQLRLFSNREYQVLVIRDAANDDIAHYSGATGRYWRWPFMNAADMQVGDTWTHPRHRGRGLARFALSRLLHRLARPGRKIWYVVDRDNTASINVAKSCGMSLAGEGRITQPRFFHFLHAFEIIRPISQERPAAMAMSAIE